MLVSMPFAAIDRPALGISTLKARLQEADIVCDVEYLSLAFAIALGREQYQVLVDDVPYLSLACEWVFASLLYGNSVPNEDVYVDEVLGRRWQLPAELVEVVLDARVRAGAFLDWAMASRSWSEYDVVGFSTVGQQNIASLALARRIKAACTRPVIVFGGHAWEGPMGRELLKQSPFVDAAFSGEADTSFPAFLRALAQDRSPVAARIPGLTYRQDTATRTVPEVNEQSTLSGGALPDFTDYFLARRANASLDAGRLLVPVETSRGCWWATRGACTFCGLSGAKRTYRTKPPHAVVRELRSRANDWPDARIDLVDNVVPETFLDQVLPELARHPLGTTISFAVRPGVGREHVRDAALAGAVLQCGVESLADGVLRLMHKGSRALENVRLLKWCREYGVDLSWNMLYAVPGELAADYEQVTTMMPAVCFLQPPDACAPVVLERFSVYFDDPSQHGLRDPRPALAYAYVYPFGRSALENVAYFFDYVQPVEADRPGYVHRLRSQTRAWQRLFGAGDLRGADGELGLTLTDGRGRDGTVVETLTGVDRTLYRACGDIAGFRRLCVLAGANPDAPEEAEQVRDRLRFFLDRDWMVSDGDRYLSVAIPIDGGNSDAARMEEPAAL